MQDHRFEGNAVFPAVEAMLVLAQAVKEFAPETDITAVTDARFDKFLIIPPDINKISALCSMTSFENGDVTAVLQTKTRSKNADITRIKEHVTLTFPRTRPDIGVRLPGLPSPLPSAGREISSDQIYRALVPFGPAYHNIAGNLTLHKEGAIAILRAPKIRDSIETSGQLGTPFVLDAAFHAACVWGQRYSGVVAFPVGVEKRMVFKPTLTGDSYIGTAVAVRKDPDRLLFDIWICGIDNSLYEIALGVHMRDVSAGRLKPPAWISGTAGQV